MIRLKEVAKNFLFEGRSKKISSKKAIQIYRNNCRMFDDTNTQIYRGISGFDGNYGVVKPKQSAERRTSAHAKNFYTLIIDNSEAWSEYPDRGESIVCTTNLKSASEYGDGDFHLVIPFDNALFGIAPRMDIWPSFSPKLTKFNRYIHNLADTAHRLSKEYSEVDISIPNPKAPPDKSYSKFKDYMERVDQVLSKEYSRSGKNKTGYELIMKGLFGTSKFGHMGREFVGSYLEFNGDLIDYFKYILDPDRNGFKVKSYSPNFEIKGEGHREVWTHSPCLLIHERVVEDFAADLGEHLGKNFYMANLV